MIAASNLPSGLNATESVIRAPVANGDPLTGDSTPPDPTENSDTVPGEDVS